MNRRVLHNLWLPSFLAVVFLFTGCGVSESLPTDFEAEKYDFNANFSQAVWHDGFDLVDSNPKSIDDAGVFVAPVLMLEDGQVYDDVLVSKPPTKEKSKTIFGIYQIDIPDADEIYFTTKIGFPYFEDPSEGNLIFRLYIQEGDDFPVLKEFETDYDGELKTFEVDMTDYRGKNVFVMVSVEANGEKHVNLQGVWVSPKISYRFR